MSGLNQSQDAPERSVFNLNNAIIDLANAVREQMRAIQDDTTHDHELQQYSLEQLQVMLAGLDNTYYPLAISIEPYQIVSVLEQATKAEGKELPRSQEEFEGLSIGGKNFVETTRARIEHVCNCAIAHVKVSAEIKRRQH